MSTRDYKEKLTAKSLADTIIELQNKFDDSSDNQYETVRRHLKESKDRNSEGTVQICLEALQNLQTDNKLGDGGRDNYDSTYYCTHRMFRLLAKEIIKFGNAESVKSLTTIVANSQGSNPVFKEEVLKALERISRTGIPENFDYAKSGETQALIRLLATENYELSEGVSNAWSSNLKKAYRRYIGTQTNETDLNRDSFLNSSSSSSSSMFFNSSSSSSSSKQDSIANSTEKSYVTIHTNQPVTIHGGNEETCGFPSPPST